MIQLNVLKVYKYRGATIYIRQLGGDIIEFLVVFKKRFWSEAKLYNDPFALAKDIKAKDVGGAMLMVCRSAESLVDALKKRHSVWYRFIGKYFDVQVAKPQTKKST